MMKVMVVDDNTEMRQMICRIIGDGAHTRECENGAEASLAYAEYLPDWVLMDLVMPEMGGIAATRLIRAAYPGARVIIVTSHDSRELREAAKEAGACAYVLKEDLFDLQRLLAGPSACKAAEGSALK